MLLFSILVILRDVHRKTVPLGCLLNRAREKSKAAALAEAQRQAAIRNQKATAALLAKTQSGTNVLLLLPPSALTASVDYVLFVYLLFLSL